MGVYNPNNIFANFNTKWTGRPGFTDWGALSPEDQQLLSHWTGNFDSSDVIYGNNPIKGFARKATGRAPYAVSDDLLKTARANPSGGVSTAARMAAETVGDAAIDAGIEKIASKGAGEAAEGVAGAATGGGLKGFWTRNVKPNFGYSAGKGLKAFGKDLGGWTGAGTILPGIVYGAKAIGNLDNLDNVNDTTEDLINDIVLSAGNNPLVNSYLTSDQKSLLSKVKRGNLDPEEFSIGDLIPNDMSGLLDIGKGALTGIAGGVPGMIVGGIGGAVNSGLEDAIADAGASQAELEALLMALQDAEMQYQSMKRPNFTGLGIQQRYQNMYM